MVRRIFVRGPPGRGADRRTTDWSTPISKASQSPGVILVTLMVDRIQARSVSTADAGTLVSDKSRRVVSTRAMRWTLTGDQAIGLAVDRATSA